MQTKILMVCLGNICRSPLAEGILKSKVNSELIFVDSAGTGHWHIGNSPDKRSIEVGLNHGIDIRSQRGRQFSANDFDNFDIIFAMDISNKENILSLARNKNDINKVRLILDEIFPDENVDVPDPYYGGALGFEKVFEMLNEACNSLANRI